MPANPLYSSEAQHREGLLSTGIASWEESELFNFKAVRYKTWEASLLLLHKTEIPGFISLLLGVPDPACEGRPVLLSAERVSGSVHQRGLPHGGWDSRALQEEIRGRPGAAGTE